MTAASVREAIVRLYNLELQEGLLLAPMAGITDWPLRLLCRRYGCELACTEMISAAGLIRRAGKTLRYMERPAGDTPLVAQLFAYSPEEAAEAARIMVDNGFAGIDINMGCPVKKVTAKGSGAALMKDVETALRMTEAVVRAVSLPVSVKIRAGWDLNSINAAEVAEILSATGIDNLAIHPRTRTEMYRGVPHWEILPAVVKASQVPVVASGNIKTPQDLKMVKDLGADACMIGRGAMGNPWIFTTIAGGPGPELSERRDVMLEHLELLCSCYGGRQGVLLFRKFMAPYVKGLNGAAHFRQQGHALEDVKAVTELIRRFFASQG